MRLLSKDWKILIEQKKIYKENKRKDCKAMFLLQQCVNEVYFEKISGVENSKETWLILEACNQGVEQLKKVRLQTLRRQYEFMQLETNEMAIEESKKVEDMKVEDLQGSLKAHEQRLIEISIGKPVDQALQAHFIDRRSFGGRNGFRGRGHKDQDRIDHDKPENSARRGSPNQWKGGRRSIDEKKVRCFNSNRTCHFSNECKTPLGQSYGRGKQHSEAHMVKEEIEAEVDD
ncbi:PREDICTED: uncharacterized protein LOC109335483 [Lupinus angustifolius]|uniref:uncharacterized protein LOC109335483 n=1 Tax=Lupinus angustifolius TaxID=3871 RepID=UPI00092FC644|nr:PREDICTED: uncharacterized protein LOC109335483 [Lupinus angustifolius]